MSQIKTDGLKARLGIFISLFLGVGSIFSFFLYQFLNPLSSGLF
jgi:hypothetical protein